MKHQTIFAKKDINRRLRNFLSEKIQNRYKKIELIQNWQQNINSGKIIKQKEEELQSRFLHTFFGDILEYNYKNPTQWNLIEEARTSFDASKADGALGFFSIDKNKNIKTDIRVVIELKNARTPLDKPQNRKDFKGSPVEQAFMYANKIGKSCKWIIVSNFLEIRLYAANDINKYESFDISSLNIDEEFNRFYYLLSKGQLFLDKQLSVVEYALENRIEEEKNISEEFYAHYKILRELFVRHLITHNNKIPALELINFAQTIIDRIVFISVVKDYELISFNILKEIEEISKKIWTNDNMELWRQLKNLFIAMDKGMPPRLHKFNGGLFKQKNEIDKLIIKDYFLSKLLKLSTYDFESDLNINILGHIFEHSISDIEKLKKDVIENNINEEDDKIDDLVKQKVSEELNQRKKYGIFYTPEYITRHIVENTVGKWLDDKKEKIGINKIQEIATSNEGKKEQLELWEKYKKTLNSITIIDPACGSGAFLTQAFDYLVKEWKIIIDVTQKLNGFLPKSKKNGALNLEINTLPDDLQAWKIKKRIVKNNIFGVDLNHESVEITKLGLWLKTATRNDNLANLKDNIKCGNSLISNIKIAKDKAFNWQNEYQQILSKGGFDIVIGNPPYGAELSEEEIKEIENKFQSFEYQANTYVIFYEKGIDLLNKNGYLGYITPATFTYQYYFKKIRKLMQNYVIEGVTKYCYEVFKDANIGDSVSWIIKKSKNLPSKIDIKIQKKETEKCNINNLSYSSFIKKDGSYDLSNNDIDFKKLYKNCEKLSEAVENIIVGIKPYQTGKGNPKQTREIVNQKVFTSNKQKDTTYRLCVNGKDFYRYTFIQKPEMYLSYGKWLAEPRQSAPFNENEKIIIRQTSDKIIAHLDNNQYINLNNVYNVGKVKDDYKLKYILALLNSKLLNYIYQNIANEKGRLFAEVKKVYLSQLPIKTISDTEQKKIEDKINELLKLHDIVFQNKQNFIGLIESDFKIKQASKQLKRWHDLNWTEFSEELEKNKVKWNMPKKKEWQTFFINEKETVIPYINEINRITKSIDSIIYKLYNLTKDEIKIVEQNVEY